MIQIFVKTLKGILITIDVIPTMTISEVKSIAIKKQGFRVNSEYIHIQPLHIHRTLDNSHSLEKCGITREQTLQMYWMKPHLVMGELWDT